MEMIKDHCEDNNFELHSERVKFKCLINGQCEEVIAYNDIIDYIEADQMDSVPQREHPKGEQGSHGIQHQCSHRV